MSGAWQSRLLLAGILLGIALGAAAGAFFGPEAARVAWLGEIFLRALKMIIVPLIVSSMIVGVASLGDVRRLGRAGGVTLLYYLSTTGIAAALGLVLVNLIRPGEGAEPSGAVPEILAGREPVGFLDVVLGMVPENIVESAARMDILPLIVFSLLFGAVVSTLGERGEPVVRFFDAVNETILKIVHLVMFFAPVGVFGLVAGKLAEVGGGAAFLEELLRVGRYALTVVVGLLLHGLVVLPLALLLVGRRRPWSYFRGMLSALGAAFSTASSSATLPVTFECVESNGVSKSATNIVLPLGATINMDGTALYEAVAAMFIAQSYGIELGAAQQVIVFFTATLAAIGAAGIPEAGLVTMVLVLQSVGLPLEGIGILLSIDWFLDRCRTTVNVWGDAVGAAVVDRHLT